MKSGSQFPWLFFSFFFSMIKWLLYIGQPGHRTYITLVVICASRLGIDALPFRLDTWTGSFLWIKSLAQMTINDSFLQSDAGNSPACLGRGQALNLFATLPMSRLKSSNVIWIFLPYSIWINGPPSRGELKKFRTKQRVLLLFYFKFPPHAVKYKTTIPLLHYNRLRYGYILPCFF